MSSENCKPDEHEYRSIYAMCPNCNGGYVMCDNCEGDGDCLGICNKGLITCPTKGCKYGYLYKTHSCIKCSKTRYVK